MKAVSCTLMFLSCMAAGLFITPASAQEIQTLGEAATSTYQAPQALPTTDNEATTELLPPAYGTAIPPAGAVAQPPTLQTAAEEVAPPSALASPAAPITRPTLVDGSIISAGDTAWVMTSAALVLLMTIPGLALFYTGMVRKKNMLGTIVHTVATVCVVSVLWVVIGYSIAFTPGSMYLGGLDRVMLSGLEYIKETGQLTVHHLAPTIPESVFIMFQMTFAIITPALITGAFAERMKFSSLLLFIALWSLVVYAPVAHWVWEPGGWLASRGVLDFAGGTVVHINAGVSGLVAALIIGPRLGFGKEPMPPHNLVLTVVGASLLWVGWFGFNAGSAVAADGRAGMAMLVTQVATAGGGLAWMAAEWFRRGKPSVLGLVSGAVSGLVAITPASGFVDTTGALIIGLTAGVACYWGATTLKSMFGYDDSLDVFGVHAIGGIVGALLTGVFAVKSIGGVDGDIANQAFGVIVTVIYSAAMTAFILFVVQMTLGLRVTPDQEREGLDLELHGEHVV